MVELSTSIDAGAVADINAAFREWSQTLGDEISTAPRRAAIQMCKSFRAATRKAPKFARSNEYGIAKSSADPKHKYITAKDGTKLRRWMIIRPPRGTLYDVYAAKKSDIRKTRLLLVRRGLAQKSWGWVMHNIFNGAAPDEPWQRRKRDKRDPRDAMRESSSYARKGGTENTGWARICNRLDYATAALKISVDDAIGKTRNWMIKRIEMHKLRASKR